jgi:HK97 family phage major capsid protein
MGTLNERNLKAVAEMRKELREKSSAILEKQAEENRPLTEQESEQLASYVREVDTLDEQESHYKEAVATEKRLLDIGQEIGAKEPNSFESFEQVQVQTPSVKSIGELFVRSEQFKAIQANRGSDFSTGPIDLSTKGTLLSGTLAPGSGTGGGFLTVPQVQPGLVQTLFQRTTVADILPSGSIDTNTLRYVVEGTATSGAAGVLEGGTKPESTLAVSTLQEPVRKIATTLSISDEMLDDAAAVESYINARLSLFIKIEEERQLLRGTSTAEVPGIIPRSGVNTYARGTVDNNAIALFKAINGTRGSSFLEPDYIIMHPDNWQTTRLLQDSNLQFYGGGPFTGAYGNGGIHGNIESGQLTPPVDSIWGKPVIVTTAPGSGTALLGSFGMAAQLFRRSGLTVEASNSHASYFTSDLVAIRAEERLALAVYRPSAFTVVTGLA